MRENQDPGAVGAGSAAAIDADGRRPMASVASGAPVRLVPLPTAVRTWALVGLQSFGGPAGQIAVMHRMLVDERRWISERRFLHALNFCMLLPGPEAQQLAVYIGWLLNGIAGGVIAGALFVLPGFVALLGLSVLYATLGHVGLVSGLLFGLQAAVVAVVVQAVLRIGRRALINPAMLALAAAAFIGIFFLQLAFPLIVLVAGVVGYVGGRWWPRTFRSDGHGSANRAGDDRVALLHDGMAEHNPKRDRAALRAAAVCVVLWLVPVAALLITLGSAHVFGQEAVLFSKTAVVTFGGAYAVLSYVAQQAVTGYGWLRPAEMLTGLGLAETTPGPLIMVVQFVGFLAAYRHPGSLNPVVAGVIGSVVTVWVTFVPCFLFIFLGAPFIERLRGNAHLSSALAAVTAAVVGVVLNLAVWFALHTAFDRVDEPRRFGVRLLVPHVASIDVASVVISIGAAVALFRLKRGVMPTLAGAALAGLVLHFAAGAGA
ncbi:MAG: chromate efflux transporter [Mycobacteriales bacterium]